MLKLIKRCLLAGFVSLGLAGCLTGCDSEELEGIPYDPDDHPNYFSTWGSWVQLPSGESQREITAHGLKGEDGIAVVYISPREIKNWEDEFNFMGESRVFDVGDYCRGLGYNDYPNTTDFFVRYEWMEINSFKSPDERDGVITVKVDANPYKKERRLWILLRNQKSSVLKVYQHGNPDGIDPE